MNDIKMLKDFRILSFIMGIVLFASWISGITGFAVLSETGRTTGSILGGVFLICGIIILATVAFVKNEFLKK